MKIKNVKVAIIDSGIELDAIHELGKRNIEVGYSVEEDSILSRVKIKTKVSGDSNGHGTACAYLINRIAPKVKIIPISILAQNGRCSSRQLIAALELAKSLDVQIVNMSISSNDIKISHKLKKIAVELQEQGKICVASKSNNRWISYPADLRNVLGVVGNSAIFSEKYEYRHDKKIQFIASGAAELIGYEFPQLKFFRGNSRAAAVVSGNLANVLASESLENTGCLERYLLHNSTDRDMLYRQPNMESKSLAVFNEVYSCICEMISSGIIKIQVRPNNKLVYENCTIEDYYMIIRMLEKNFSCRIFGKICVYRRYFETVSYLSSLVESAKNG